MTDNDYLFDLFRELGFSDFVAQTGDIVLSILLVLMGAAIVARLGARFARRSVESLVARSTLPGTPPRSRGRAAALGGVASSVVRIVVWFVGFLLVLGQFDVNLGPLIAVSSVVGVAVGFGAQSIVKDFLSGFFLLAEDQFGVGDVITVVGTTATVEDVNLRTTRLRSTDGTVWFVPNGEIRKVGNEAKGWSRAIVDILLPPGADVTVATGAIAEELGAFAQDPAWSEAVLEAPEVLGVEAMGVDGTTVRVAVKTPPDDRARVGRELRARIGARLLREGIIQAKDPVSAPPAPTDVGSSEEEASEAGA